MLFDLVRIFVVALLTALLMFVIQPFLFSSGAIALTDVDPVEWVGQQYTWGAVLVYGVSLLFALIWYALAARSKAVSASEISAMRALWGVLLLPPILAIGAALYFFNNSNEALLWITGFYVLDVLLLYWFGTAIGSPNLLKYVPPGSMFLRSLIPGL